MASIALLLAVGGVRRRARGRERILRHVLGAPGRTVGQLGRDLDLSAGTVYFHVTRLVLAGQLETRSQGRRRLVFPVGYCLRLEDVAKSILLSGTARQVAQFIRDHPGCDRQAVLAGVPGSPRAIYYNLKLLKERKLVVASSPTRYRGLRLAFNLDQLDSD